jgi:diguanylate cyclase (GGDEF)-like protein
MLKPWPLEGMNRVRHTEAAKPLTRRFPLVRHFSVAALAALVVTSVVLGVVHERQEMESLALMGESHNVTLTKTFRNFLWHRFEPMVAASRGVGAKALRANPDLPVLREAVINLMRDTQAVKVKVYNLEAKTVFSTDLEQVGESKAGNPGFVGAAAGRVMTTLVHKDSFDTFEGVIEDRDLIASYLPIRGADGKVEAVFELYRDVTPLVAHMRDSQRTVIASVTLAMAMLYALLFIIIWRAQTILDRQRADLESSLTQIQQDNRLLDQRVQERTAELSTANRSLESEVNERKSAELKLAFLAHHDPLTGLPNRILLQERIELAIHRAKRGKGRFAVIFIDLDNFKTVNDTLGHPIGDILLQQVTQELQRHVRGVDTLARLGGDEFILLVEITDQEHAEAVAQKIIEVFSRPYHLVDHELYLGATMGISIFPRDGGDGHTLIRNADTAMYRAKAAKRGSYGFYAPEMTASAEERLRLDSMLRRALDNGELYLAYQPQVDLASGAMVGVEALLRWQHPTMGSVPPSRFIPVAEESGFINELGIWVLRQACLQMRNWIDGGADISRIAVNVSVKQFARGGFVDSVRAVLRETGIPAGRLELEITETAIMLAHNVHALLLGLREAGVLLSIDDFGTGYSSLSYLKQLPIQKLKIDRSFVRDLEGGENDLAIVRSVIALARTMGLTTLAEGVENEDQARFLVQEGCEQAQGFLYSKAVSAEEVARIRAGGKIRPQPARHPEAAEFAGLAHE